MSRMWEFDSNDIGSDIISFPATDEPMSSWYQEHMTSVSALE